LSSASLAALPAVWSARRSAERFAEPACRAPVCRAPVCAVGRRGEARGALRAQTPSADSKCSVSSFWKRPAWDFSALARVSNQSAISVEALLAGGLGHARVHVGVLVGLARDAGLEVALGVADGQAGGRVAHRLEVVEVAVRVARSRPRRCRGSCPRPRGNPPRRPPWRSRGSDGWPATRPRRRP
jgi:hypothetical protein